MQSPLLGMAGSILFVAILLALLVHFGAHEKVVGLLEWFEAQGRWVPLLFILIMAAVVVLLLPGIFFTTGAGFVFGVVEGSLYVVTGTTLGAVAAFLIARYLFGQHARAFILSHAKLRLVSDEITPHGWKIVLLTRLIPFFPSKISNYFFGLTHFSLRGYIGGSFLGSIVADVSVLTERGLDRSPLEWTLYGAGFLATVITIVYLNRLARRALARYEAKGVIEEDCS